MTLQCDLPHWLPAELSTGTTLCALEFPGGVVLAADTRTSMGSIVSNRCTNKITPVSSQIMVCRSGSAADTQAIADQVQVQLEWLELEMAEPPRVQTAAHYFKAINYQYRDQLLAGMIVAGWDRYNGGQVYSVPVGGGVFRQPAVIGGSGSSYIYGLLDVNYKPGMSKEACIDLAKTCVAMAIHRDQSSGGCCRMAIVTEHGVERRVFKYPELPNPFAV